MTTKIRCPKCNGLGNFILNIETNETSCKNCGVVFNKLTTKEKLEQLGWQESVVNKKNIYKEFDGIYIYTSKDGIDINGTNEDTFIDTNELQLILDYIKEQENDK